MRDTTVDKCMSNGAVKIKNLHKETTPSQQNPV